jgi:formylmethanofuran dehydrogenase subunit D
MDLTLNTIRMVDHDQMKEYSFGDENSLKEHLAIGLLNPEDYKSLNLSSKLNLKLSNNFGHVIVKPIQDKDVPIGTINMPVSFWANQITGIEKNELIYKNLKVFVEVTNDIVKTVKDLLNLSNKK